MRPQIRRLAPVVAIATMLVVPRARAATEPNTLVNPLVGPNVCVNCHNPPNAEVHAGDPSYAPFTTWQGSMMANSARDPVFWAGLAIASQDQSNDMGNGIAETPLCVRCHAPRAFLEGRGNAISQDELLPADFQGVECELCHRMVVAGIGSVDFGQGNALYTIDDVVTDGIVPRRGPWAYEASDPYPPPHAWLNDPSIGSSELCGTCHDVTTPRARLDDAGVPTGTFFNEQRTYREWASSAFASPEGPRGLVSCQDCHMPAVDDMAACNANMNLTSHPEGGRRHALAGANVFMLQILDSLYGDAGTMDVPSTYYQQTQDAVLDVLATAATLELDPPDAVELGVGIPLGVRVTNETGHKLPTGYSEGRVMWLEVIVRYGEQVVVETGLPEHVEERAPDPYLRTYRAVAEQFSTGMRNHLLLNDHWVEDTRIPPLGLTQGIDVDPVGGRYEVLPDGNWPNFDDFTYEFAGAPEIVDVTPDDPTDDDLDVSVRLLYRINTPEYIEFLAAENVTNDAGATVADLFDVAGGSPAMVLAEQTTTIPISSFGPVSATSTGVVDDSGSADGSEADSSSDEAPAPTSTGPVDPTSPPGDGSDSSSSTGTGATGESAGGCGCRTDGGARGPWLLGVCLAVFVGLRRRRLVHSRR